MVAAYTAATSVGDIIKVHKTHTRALSADEDWTAASAHTFENPLKVIVVDKDNSDAPVAGYADMTTNGEEGDTNNKHIRLEGNQFMWGMRMVTGDNSAFFNNSNGIVVLEECGVVVSSTTNEIMTAGIEATIRLVNTDIVMQGGGSHYWSIQADGTHFIMHGGAITAANNPASLFVLGQQGPRIELHGVDLSGVDPSTYWIDFATTADNSVFEMHNCALPASPPALSESDLNSNIAIATGCGGTDGRYYSDRRNFQNTISHSTSTYRTGGASYDGTNGYSLNPITASVSDGALAFRNLLAILDPGSLSGTTVTVHFTHDVADNTGKMQDDEMWIEIHALDGSGGVIWETSRARPTATPSDITDDSAATWTAGKTYEQKIDHTWAGGATAGLVYVYLCVAKAFAGGAGADVFVCPKVEVA